VPSVAARRIAAAAFIVLGVSSVVTRVDFRPEHDASPEAGAITDDFLFDYLSARAWRTGLEPYDETGTLRTLLLPDRPDLSAPAGQRNPHPPVMVLLVVPLSFLGYDFAHATWILLMAALYAGALGWFVHTLGTSILTASTVGVGALAIPIVQRGLSFAQHDALLLLLVVAAWGRLRRGRDLAAGWMIGVAGAAKLFPALLILGLIRERRTRAVGTTIAVGAAVTVLSAAIVGPDATSGWLGASSSNFDRWRAGPLNISLMGLPFRWLSRNPWREVSVDLPVLAWTVAVVVALACIVAALRTPARVSADMFWSAAPWILLASPLAWDHYAALVLPVVALGIHRASKAGELPPLTFAIGAAIVVIGTLPGLPVAAQEISDPVLLFGYGLPTYGLLLMAIADWRGKRVMSGAEGRSLQGS